MINCHLFVNLMSGKILVSQCARTEAGFWVDIEPVISADLNDDESIGKALEVIQTSEVLTIPTPPRDSFPKPVILRHAKVRSWIELERKFCQFFIWTRDEDMALRLEGWKPIPGQRGMVPDLMRVQIIPKGWTFTELSREIALTIRTLEKDPDGLPVRP